MPINRRNFLKETALASGAIFASSLFPFDAAAANVVDNKLTILHTNDVHSRLQPFPQDGSRNAGLGGVAARAEIIKQIRVEASNVLLLDAGDIFQGTPYFNFYGGELEIKMMSMMGYDASIMGNHDFDNGVEGFVKQLPHANFPILNANYDFTDTEMEGKSKSFQIFKKDGVKIGVYGLGIELTGLVNPQQYGNTKYVDPLQKAQELEKFLRFDQKCDLVICLSHLGYKYREEKVSDVVLAQNTYETDLIIGGHTHTFLNTPDIIKNKNGRETLVNQVGFGGINLGRIDFAFSKNNNKKVTYNSSIEVIENNFKY